MPRSVQAFRQADIARARGVAIYGNNMVGEARWHSSLWNTTKLFTYGLIAGLVYTRALKLYQKWRLPSATVVQSSLLPMLRANEEVRAKVGSSLKAGPLTAYSYSGGLRWRIPRVSQRQKWSGLVPVEWDPWALQMLFQVIGEKSTALVTLETKAGKLAEFSPLPRFKFLMVDFRSGERLVVKGALHQTTVFKFDTLNPL